METTNNIFTSMEIRLFFGGLMMGISIGMLIGKMYANYILKENKKEEENE